MLYYSKTRVSFVTILLLFISLLGESCTKSDPAPPTTPIVNPPPPPPPPPVPQDTVSLIKRLEAYYNQSNPNIIRPNRNYSFYYDHLKRVVTVGIKNFGGVLFDTATTRIFYSGNNMYPEMIIAPNSNLSSFNGPTYYDTTWFFYNNGILVSDSSFAKYYGANLVINRTPLKRYYKFEANRLLADWYGVITTAGPYERMRTDTLNLASGTDKIERLKMQWYAGGAAGNHASVESFTYSNYVNPLAKLNISGSVFSVLYTPVRNEVLGNNAHKAVHHSNSIFTRRFPG